MADRSLCILQVITPARYSGAERMVTYLSSGLRARGHRVIVAAKPNQILQRELTRRGVEMCPLGISGKVNLLAPGRIARLARQMNADIIHTHLSTASLWGTLAGRLLGVPTLAHVHALNTKYFYLLADVVVTPSQGVRDHLIAQGMSGDRVQVVYNGIPASRFVDLTPSRQIYQELDLSPDQPIVAVAAHLSAKKGHRYLLEAVERLGNRYPRLACLVIGEGPLRARLEKLTARLHISDHVRFLGYRDDAVALMQVCDVIVLPSIAKEGLGLCLIEAAFLGKPTVGSRAPGITEAIVDGQTGLLVPPGDSPAMAGALDELLSSPELRATLGAAGKTRAQQMFTMDVHTQAIERLYRQVIAQHQEAK